MDLNTTYFCSLSSSPIFLKWLSEFNQSLYDELTSYLRVNRGCSANTEKMIWVRDEICKINGGEAALFSMLRTEFPYILTQGQKVPQAFSHKSVLTLPLRTVLDTEEAAKTFLLDKPLGEYMVHDDKVYVEYVTQEYIHLAPAIPESNWLVRIWKKELKK